jgi:serine protease Do
MSRRAAALAAFLALVPAASSEAALSKNRNTPVVQVTSRCAPSVVNISTEQVVLLRNHPFWGQYGANFDAYFGEFYREVGTMKFPSVGSGVIVSDDGVIVTNAHVVNMANRIFVNLKDGTQHEAIVLGVSQQDDLALLKIKKAAGLRTIPMAKDVVLGETVVAIGNPLGLHNSVSTGVISGIGRAFVTEANQAFTGLLQTDASVNPGNSGGALLNLDGELVGINLAVVEDAQNISFAIPASKVAKMLEAYEKVKDQVVTI